MSRSARELPAWVDAGLIPVLNLVAAFLVTGIVILIIGESPIESVRIMLTGAFGYGEGLGYTLFYTTNFIFTGLAFAVALHAGLFNIGTEGQAYLGGLGVALVCLGLGGWPMPIVIVLAIIASALFGAAWAFVPAYLQAKRGSHIVITTIMFNFIAAAFMVYLLVNVLSPPGSMQPETRTFDETARLPLMHNFLAGIGITIARSPLNLSFFWALICAGLVQMLMWHTILGYKLRVLGQNPEAAVYAGMKPDRLIIIAMLISGGLAGFMALNEVMGSQTRLVLEFTSGYGFVGIAVALMGRSRPIGIILAALLFGALYQGGAELAFEKPEITRQMIVIIQGLVILFAGALEHMFRPQITRLFQRWNPQLSGAWVMEWFDFAAQIASSAIRLSVPLLFACLAGLYSERSGVFDIGLEGKMLVGAFAAGACAAITGSAWLGLLGAIIASIGFSLIHGFASITHRGNQIVSGVAINFMAFGLTAQLGATWFGTGGQTPQLGNDARFLSIVWPFADALRGVPIIGHVYSQILSGHNVLVYLAFLAVPLTWWVLYRTRFGLRLRAVGENPAAVDTAGISVSGMRYSAVICAGILCGFAGAYLSIAQSASFVENMTAGKGFIALAALIFAKWRPVSAMWACLLFGVLEALAIRLQGVPIAGVGPVPVQLMQAVPYILTVILLAGFIGRAVPPKAGGVAYVKEK